MYHSKKGKKGEKQRKRVAQLTKGGHTVWRFPNGNECPILTMHEDGSKSPRALTN